jgi:hypothetical protein
MPRILCIHIYASFVALVFAMADVAIADDRPNDRSELSQTSTRLAEQRAAKLVRKLGDSSFQVRRDATRELTNLGLPALSALRQASQDDDLEIRYRASRLFQKVRLQAHSLRLEQFLANPKSFPVDELPGLQRYRKIVGNDEAARKLFVEMQRAETELFLLLAGDPKIFEDEYNTRSIQAQYLLRTGVQRDRATASTAALMFLATQPKITVADQAVTSICGLANYTEFRTQLTAKPSPLRRLAGHWIVTEQAGAAQQRLLLALRNNLQEGIVLALAVLKAPANAYELQYALLTVGRFGGRDHVAAVEKLFENRMVLTRSGGNGKAITYSCEIRDVALAVAAHLNGEDARKEFGFSRLTRNSQYLFNPNTAGFNDEATRTAAFKKWADSKANSSGDGAKNSPRDPTPSDD